MDVCVAGKEVAGLRSEGDVTAVARNAPVDGVAIGAHAGRRVGDQHGGTCNRVSDEDIHKTVRVAADDCAVSAFECDVARIRRKLRADGWRRDLA